MTVTQAIKPPIDVAVSFDTLPTPGDEAAWGDKATVNAIAGVDQWEVERLHRGAEATWIENARQPVDWSSAGWPA